MHATAPGTPTRPAATRVGETEPLGPVPPHRLERILMNQDWRDLTYVHWAVPATRVAPLLPPGVRPDEHDGATYVGLVPFRMVDAGPGRRSSVPWLGTFLETNVRLYTVDRDGRRGVLFRSLDCERLAVVAGARLGFAVPYRWSRMRHDVLHTSAGEVHTYASRLRAPRRAASSVLTVRVGAPREATPLDLFLSARWRLHTRMLGATLRVPNEHGVWPLHDAEVLELRDELLASVGFDDLAGRTPDHVAFSPGVHTRFGLPERVGAQGASRSTSQVSPERR
ncbi:DUF2071 domain-containing protein [Nocardioides zeae]|uniref:DUF2071 domain-containing protein n=1 Tax=Nocardioides imazamoxiresistens TaxID=3231893 RepID=A0ABU3PRZ8_9ACTN|nr:DUF2071 domain-containing protein [Nocardioides zeae]MDT9591998.1 DUF2071 domain-containing protein [Nocardioides zeae]